MQYNNNSRDPDANLVPIFKQKAMKNERLSLEAGRPIYEDVEVVEIRAPGSRNYPVVPATEFCGWAEDPETGEQTKITYAERFKRQYQQFKAQAVQTKSGTPLDQVPFLTDARRAELRAQNVYTVEMLADIEGQELKNLGPGGREMKNKAVDFITEARMGVPNLQLQADNDALRARLQMLEEDNQIMKQRVSSAEAQFEEMNEQQLIAFIRSETGHTPQGNLPHKVLVRMAMDARPTKVA